MRILFTRLTDERHRLEVIRDDGSREARELETRSFLVHDLAHFAVESQAGLEGGFWGTVARGASFAELSASGMGEASPELLRAERLAAPFQSLWHGRLERTLYVEHAGVDEAFVEGALERMRQLVGHWRATPFGGVMELRWGGSSP